jgi:hypothetical protein
VRRGAASRPRRAWPGILAALAMLPAVAPEAAAQRRELVCFIEQAAAVLERDGVLRPATVVAESGFRFTLTMDRNTGYVGAGYCSVQDSIAKLLECSAPVRLRTAPSVIDALMYGDGSSFFGPHGNSRLTLLAPADGRGRAFEASWSTIAWGGDRIDWYLYRGRCAPF